MSRPIIATCFYAESEADESEYFQVHLPPATSAFQDVYWRAITVGFATSWVQHGDAARHVLITNAHPPKSVDGFDLAGLFDRFGIEVHIISFDHAVPATLSASYRGCFFKLDALQWLARTLEADQVGYLVDSDCVWLGPASRLEDRIRHFGVSVLDLQLDPYEPINDITRIDAQAIYAQLELPIDLGGAAPPHYGGEFYAGTGAALRDLVQAVELVHAANLDSHRRGQPALPTEEYVLTAAAQMVGASPRVTYGLARRLWTDGSYRTVRASDIELDLWHVPSEKTRGLARLFTAFAAGHEILEMHPGREWRLFLADILSVTSDSVSPDIVEDPVVTGRRLRKLGRRIATQLRAQHQHNRTTVDRTEAVLHPRDQKCFR